MKIKILEEKVDIFDGNSFKGITIGSKTFLRRIIFFLGLIAVLIPIYEVLVSPLYPGYQRTLHLFFIIGLTFFLYPSEFFKNNVIESIFNIILIMLLAFVCIWATYRWTYFYVNPSPLPIEALYGLVFVLLVFEATRRVIGWPMPIIGAVFLLYCFIGPYPIIPRYFAHPGYTPTELVTHIIVGTEGMMGKLAAISATQIVFFMMFAAFLKMTKSTEVFMNFSKAIAGSRPGGPAKIAVVASGFMAMVSGSASGNVATTGSVTIPLMISLGYKKHIAAAIEAVSSTAGQFMPPIMGATAFVIAEYTNNSYWDVATAAFVPAVLFFVVMFFVVDIVSKKNNISGIEKDKLPLIGPSAKKLLPIMIPIIVLVLMLASRMSIQISIIYSLITLVIVCIPIKDQRIGIKKVLEALSLTARILIPITTACAVAGLIVGVMTLTGFGERLTYGILIFSGGSLLKGLFFTSIICLILGMGLPTLGAYVVLATLGAPALVQLGSPLIAAHLFIFYFAIISAITPPVCLSAYVGASIAGAKPLRVGITAMTLALFIYVLPYLFVYDVGLLLEGSIPAIILSIFKALLILFSVTIITNRFLFTNLKYYEIIGFCIGLFVLFYTNNIMIFSAIFFVIFIIHFFRVKKLKEIQMILLRNKE